MYEVANIDSELDRQEETSFKNNDKTPVEPEANGPECDFYKKRLKDASKALHNGEV
jgi:hypothetical protein